MTTPSERTMETPEPMSATLHLRHFYDGHPLCWPQDQEGEFTATPNEMLVDCPECLQLMTREDV